MSKSRKRRQKCIEDYQKNSGGQKNRVCIAVNICTYRREEQLNRILDKLQGSAFFDQTKKTDYSGALYIYVVDNACELSEIRSEYMNLRHNPRGNTGGAGDYQYGIELIRSAQAEFTHVVFMDDDVEFDLSCFYRLFDFLQQVKGADASRPVAGRMFRMDRRDIQYTAGEIWNAGRISHVGFNRTAAEVDQEPEIICDSGAEYGGWWFCCFPYDFVKKNDIMPFFIHCDDVEYGLRYGRPPVIIRDVKVWHETFEYRQTPVMRYYDTRNPLFVNEKYQLNKDAPQILSEWKQEISAYHADGKWDYEYYVIRGMLDYLKGMKWLYRVHPGKYHDRLKKARTGRYKNAILWRIAERRFRGRYEV